MHVCSANFLEEFIEEYGNCDDEIVYLRDGSLLSLHQFMSHVNTSTALTEGVEGVWKKRVNLLDSTRTQGKKKHLNDLKWRIPFLLSAGPFECLMIRITSKKELTSSSLSFGDTSIEIEGYGSCHQISSTTGRIATPSSCW